MKLQEISEYLRLSTLLQIAAVILLRYFLGIRAGRIVLKSQTLVPQGSGRPRLNLNSNHATQFEYLNVMTTDNVILDTVEINPVSRSANEPYVIKFNGNSMTYHDHLEAIIAAANDMGAVIIAFDYPNVGNSGHIKLYSQQPLVNAGIAQVQRLLNKGLAPSQITLDGSSLGGAIATLVAKHFYDLEPSIHLALINDRSFSSVTAVGASMIGTDRFNFLIKPLLYALHWEVNALAAFQKLPKSKRLVLFSKHDQTIHYDKASFHKAIEDSLDPNHAYEIINGNTLDQEVHRAPRTLLLNQEDEPATDVVKKFVLQSKY